MTTMLPSPTPANRRARLAVRVARGAAIAAGAAILVLVGVWITGGLLTQDFRLAMALTAAWFGVAGLASLAAVRASRAIGGPVLLGYVVAAAAIGGYLGYATLNDRVVDETVVTGTPASAMPAAATGASAGKDDANPKPPAMNVEEARGAFRSGEHETRGTARVIRLAEGGRVLTLTGFETDAGPDLRVRVVPGGGADGGAGNALDVGALKGNRGDQQYRLPAEYRPGRDAVVIWCRAFSVQFGNAQLRTA